MSEPSPSAELPDTFERAGRRLHPFVGVVVGLAFVVAAVALTIFEPNDIQREQPFVTTATTLNKPFTTREFNLAVTDARLADRLTSDEWVGTTDGTWLVVDVLFAARIKSTNLSGTLTVNGVDYLSSQRIHDNGLDDAFSDPGLVWQRSMVFELPTSVTHGAGASEAVVQFAAHGDPRLDGVIDFPVDLTTLKKVSSIALTAPGRVAG